MTISEIGIFARCFPRPAVAGVVEAIRSAGFILAQFNFSAIGQPTLNPQTRPGDLKEIASAFRRGGISIWGLSATCNTIHPDTAGCEVSADAVAVELDSHHGADSVNWPA